MKSQSVGRPPIGVTKKVSITLSQKAWNWLEKQAVGVKSKILRNVILQEMRRSMICELLDKYPDIKITVVQGKGEFSERIAVPMGQVPSVVTYVTDQNMFVSEKGPWTKDEDYMIIDIILDPDTDDYIDDHFLYS